MKRLIGTFVLMIVVLAGFGGCSDIIIGEPNPITEMKDFTYINTQVYTQNRELMDDIIILNQWLRANPNKKVISFSGVLAYREGVSGYVVYSVSGDNSQQKFEQINRRDRILSRQTGKSVPVVSAHGIHFLQEWKDAHQNMRIVAISTVPSYSGGVREFTICYEQ